MDKSNTQTIKRAPVVVIVGHIDHGKSTLLDYIRKSNTTEKEAGGITQHISAYETEIEVSGEKRKITFLDTPGHEAFFAIRERGTRIADMAILIISAEDSVKPQTIEALKSIEKNKLPFIVAVSKIDKAKNKIDKIKQDLAENEVFVEGWGGNVPLVAISGKTGENVDELLEMIILQSDIEGLTGDPSLPAQGFVIESSLNKKEGISATLIIKDGTLKTDCFLKTDGAYTKVRIIENYKGEKVKEASFSSPIKIAGWSSLPIVGNQFQSTLSKEEATSFAQKKENKSGNGNNQNNSQKLLEVVIKADTFGSLEAIEYEIKKLGDDLISIRLISKGVGDISENDIKSALIKKSLVLGFGVGTEKNAKTLSLRENIEIKNFNIIYELIDFLKEKMASEKPVVTKEELTGSTKILKTFSKNKDKQVVGGRVEEGEIKENDNIKIFRRENMIGEGKIKGIQTQKIKSDSVKSGEECGIMVDSKIEIMSGDILKSVSFIKK